MIKNVRRAYVLITVMVIVLYSPINAVQQSTVKTITSLIAIVSAGTGYLMSDKADVGQCVYGGIIVTSITALAYHFLSMMTPEGQLKHAEGLLKGLASDKLIKTHFTQESEFFDAVQDVYLTDDLPLISAYNHLLTLIPLVRHTCELIKKASDQACGNGDLTIKCDASLFLACSFFKDISQGLKWIRKHKDYLPQLQLYKEFVTPQQRLLVQAQTMFLQHQLVYSHSAYLQNRKISAGTCNIF